MGAVYDEFQRELAVWHRRYAGRPHQEMIQLFLLALEREELVSVGYRETAIVRRLRTMPLAPEVRELIRHALLWLWKDEEMHTVYIRGVILRLGSRWLRWLAFSRQLAGAVGGWSASVRQHARWSAAPLSRGLATLLTWLGALLGKVPHDVRENISVYGPFRNFCLFNVDAEDTAQLCWQRLIDLSGQLPAVDPNLFDAFRRICADEERHGRIFRIFAAALDQDDRLVSGETVPTLAHKIAQVSDYFVSHQQRRRGGCDHPLGQGGPVWVVQGTTAAEKLSLFRRLLDDAGLARQITEQAGKLGKPLSALRLVIKPTFMLGYHRKDVSHITDPVLLDALAQYLGELGCGDVAVVESPNIYDQFYRHRSVREVAAYFGFVSPHYRLVDLSEEQVPHAYGRGLAQYTIGRTWRDVDFRISFGKMRSHAVEMVHLTLGNVEWLGARCDEFLFVERQAQRETAVMMLVDDFPPHFALLDGYDTAADGLMGVMGCPRPRSPRRFYAGADALAVNLVAGRHLGLEHPDQSRILQAACHWFGDPTARLQVVGIDTPVRGWRSPYHTELTTLLSFFAYPVYQFGSGRGTLFVPEMDEEAFPRSTRKGSGFAWRAGSCKRSWGCVIMAARSVLVIGAGMGGLTAVLRLAHAGLVVRVVEARCGPGGLAAGLELDGLPFDAGPYILLDRPGLEWAFRAVNLELAEHVPLRRIEDLYEVRTPDGVRVRFQASLGATAADFERQWPGSGSRYLRHVHRVARIHRRLEPLQRAARPGLWGLIRSGGWRHLPFLLGSLHRVLAIAGLPQPVADALAIWTHIAGQRVEEAPSPLALVPALFHGVGAFYPVGGIGRIPRVLAEAAVRAGVMFDYGVKVTAIGRKNGRAAVARTDRGDTLTADAILSNAAGVGTYLDLLEGTPPAARARLEQLPLQSPGVAAYLAVKGEITPPYLRFYLPGGDERCRCLVLPAVMEPEVQRDGWYPARLIVPMDHALAQAAGPAGQRQYLERLLAEPWWREQIDDYRVLATRIPAEWGAQYHLFRDSMNPVMTARFMRAGRLAHRSPYLPGLYLAGSATHPGQWVSFCAISGILAANQLLEAFR